MIAGFSGITKMFLGWFSLLIGGSKWMFMSISSLFGLPREVVDEVSISHMV